MKYVDYKICNYYIFVYIKTVCLIKRTTHTTGWRTCNPNVIPLNYLTKTIFVEYQFFKLCE